MFGAEIMDNLEKYESESKHGKEYIILPLRNQTFFSLGLSFLK